MPFTPGRGTYNRIRLSNDKIYPLLLENYDNANEIVVNSIISKKANDNTFEIITGSSINKYKIEKDEIENIIKLLDDKMTKDLYFIDLLGTYYEKNKVQFTKSNIHKFIFFNNLTSENISNYSILGFVFELSNINTINELQLRKMFGLKYASLLKDKLFDKAYDNLNYKFKHKKNN